MYEKKHSSRKAVALILTLALLIGCAVGGTLAWLVADTDPLVNTFSPGNIHLSLAEPSWNPNHTGTDGVERYKAIPGDQILKDPTVTVGANSADCYVRLFVVIWWEPITDGFFKAADSDDWFKYKKHSEYTGYWNQDNCIKLYDETNDYVLGIVNEFRYSETIQTSSQDQTLRPLFDYIQVPMDLDQDQFASLDNFKLIVFAQAVQAAGSANANEAFEKAGIPNITLSDCKNSVGQAQTLAQIVETLQKQDELYPRD